MRPIINDEFVIAVDFQVIETDHKTFQNGFSLKSDDTVDIAFVLRDDHSAIYRFGDVGQKIVLVTLGAQFTNWNCKGKTRAFIGRLIATGRLKNELEFTFSIAKKELRNLTWTVHV